jgi:hypothetical protein
MVLLETGTNGGVTNFTPPIILSPELPASANAVVFFVLASLALRQTGRTHRKALLLENQESL